MADYKMIGKRAPRIDAHAKVSGEAQFVSDFKLPDMLYGKILRSPHPHARILSLDTSAAERLPGVLTVVTAEDTLKLKFGPMIADEQILAVDKVRYIGDEVAVVIAEDEDTAEDALDLIQVEYEILPAVFDCEEAAKDGAVLVHEERENNRVVDSKMEQGDVEEGFRQSDLIVEGRFETPLVHQCYVETTSAVARYLSEGKVEIWGPCQEPFIARDEIAHAMGMKSSDVRIIQPYVGGGFGGKCDVKLLVIAAAVAKKAAGRPVQLAYSRHDEFIASRPRMPIVFYYKTGVKKDGTIMAKEVKLIGDNGAYSSQGPPIVSVAAIRSDSLYRFKNIRTQAILAYTNKVPTGAFRGFGNPQCHFALESHLDDIARKLNMDPLELRKKNATQVGDVTCYGWEIDSCGYTECLEKGAERIGWQQKWHAAPQQPVNGKLRGVGVSGMIHVSGNRAVCQEYDGSSAVVQVHEDGKLTVFCGEPEVGQGSTTVFAQIAAEELGVPLDYINVISNDTARTPHGIGTFASRVTTLGGSAVKLAAIDARRQLAEIAEKVFEMPADGLTFADYQVKAKNRDISFAELARAAASQRCGLEVSGLGMYDVGFPLPDAKTKYGNASVGYPFGAQFAEVEVDVETGQISLLNFVAAQDVGYALNPTTTEGQIQGGVAQGCGFALMEEEVLVDGRVINANWRDYKVPTPVDLPHIEVILVESNEPKGPYGAKGAGEAPIVPTAPAIANAVYNATGIRFYDLPITAEKVYRALQKKHS